MGMIPTDSLVPGMVLATDVHDRSGRLLLGTGTELTDKHLYIFRTWGVIEVDIVGAEESDTQLPATIADAFDPEAWHAAEAEVTPLFRHTDMEHPAIKELVRLAILRKVRHGTP